MSSSCEVYVSSCVDLYYIHKNLYPGHINFYLFFLYKILLWRHLDGRSLFPIKNSMFLIKISKPEKRNLVHGTFGVIFSLLGETVNCHNFLVFRVQSKHLSKIEFFLARLNLFCPKLLILISLLDKIYKISLDSN